MSNIAGRGGGNKNHGIGPIRVGSPEIIRIMLYVIPIYIYITVYRYYGRGGGGLLTRMCVLVVELLWKEDRSSVCSKKKKTPTR